MKLEDFNCETCIYSREIRSSRRCCYENAKVATSPGSYEAWREIPPGAMGCGNGEWWYYDKHKDKFGTVTWSSLDYDILNSREGIDNFVFVEDPFNFEKPE